MTIKELKEKLSERAARTLDELEDYVYPSARTLKTESDLLDAIKEDGPNADVFDEIIYEMADGRVSVYTRDRLEWLTENLGRADQENAIGCGAKTAEDIAAYCWYDAEREDINEDIKEIQKELNA